jgi:hypothetical protein
MPHDDLKQLRAELRRLYCAAPGGTWSAPAEQALRGGLVAIAADGSRTHLGALFYGESVAQLAAAARNALPVLFAEIDKLRARLGVRVLGDVVDDGRVVWRTCAA